MNVPQILQQLNGAMMPNMQPIRQIMQMVRGAGNPQAMLESMASTNPQMRQVMDVIRQSGNDPQKAFYAMCEQKGVDPQQILDALK